MYIYKCIGRKVDKTLNLLLCNVNVYTLVKTTFIKKEWYSHSASEKWSRRERERKIGSERDR